MRPWRRRDQARISLNTPGTCRTTERLPSSVAGDELQCLRGIVGGRTRLSHSTSWDTNRSPLPRGTGARRLRHPQAEARASPAVPSDQGDDLRPLAGHDVKLCSQRSDPAAAPYHSQSRLAGRSWRRSGATTRTGIVPPERRKVSPGTCRCGPSSRTEAHRVSSALAGRCAWGVVAVHQSERPGGALGGLRQHRSTHRPLDVLAWRDLACELARQRPARRERPVGEAWDAPQVGRRGGSACAAKSYELLSHHLAHP